METATFEPEEVWSRILRSLGESITLKGGKPVTFRRLSDRVIEVEGRTAPSITFALVEASLKVWPTPNVSDLPDQGNSSYVWALLRHVTGHQSSSSGSAPLDEIRQLVAERDRIDSEIRKRICAAAEGDWSLRRIAEAAGTSHQTVARIVSEGS